MRIVLAPPLIKATNSKKTETVNKKRNSSFSAIAILLAFMLTIPAVTSCVISVQVPLGPSYSAEQPEMTTKEKLLQNAQERGWARIIVTWRMDEYRSVQHILDELETKNLNITVGRTMQLNPRTSMAVDEEALLYLYKSDMVERIEENRSIRAF